MSTKKKDTEYLFLSATLRAREARMLTRERMERMLDAPSFAECARTLEDAGFGDMSGFSAGQIEAELSGHRRRVFEEIRGMTPEPAVVDVFRLKYDYHNAKTLIKAQGAGIDGASILSDSGRVDPAALAGQFHSEEYSDVPAAVVNAVTEARGVLARTGNPQLADIVLDKAQYAELLNIAAQMGSDFLAGYIRLMIDSANLRAAVRTLRIGRDTDFLKSSLITGGNVDADRIISCAASSEGLAPLYIASPLERAGLKSAEVISGGPLTEFERMCDDAVTRYLSGAKLQSFGEGPVIAHLAAVEAEITAARMILIGRLSGIEPDIIRERLRESYV